MNTGWIARQLEQSMQTAGLARDAAGQSRVGTSPPQTHKHTHPGPEQAIHTLRRQMDPAVIKFDRQSVS